MNDSYTKAACGCPGGWKAPGRAENLILNAVGIAGGVAFVAVKLAAVAHLFGLA